MEKVMAWVTANPIKVGIAVGVVIILVLAA